MQTFWVQSSTFAGWALPRGSTGRRPVRKKRPTKWVFFFWFPLRFSDASSRSGLTDFSPHSNIYVSIYLSIYLSIGQRWQAGGAQLSPWGPLCISFVQINSSVCALFVFIVVINFILFLSRGAAPPKPLLYYTSHLAKNTHKVHGWTNYLALVWLGLFYCPSRLYHHRTYRQLEETADSWKRQHLAQLTPTIEHWAGWLQTQFYSSADFL